MKKIIFFLKYNNFSLFVVLIFFLAASGVFAQTEVGRDLIGQKTISVQGVDNALLLSADIAALNLNFEVEKIEESEQYYFITYTYLDFIEKDKSWQYQLQEKAMKVSKRQKQDLGEYLAEEFSELSAARKKDLLHAQELARDGGVSRRVEVEGYDGLIGRTLDVAARVFPGYEPFRGRELPSPTSFALKTVAPIASVNEVSDDLAATYNTYIAKQDPDGDNIFGNLDNCPTIINPLQEDMDIDNVGDACDAADSVAEEGINGVATSTVDNAASREEVVSEEVIENEMAPIEEGVAVDNVEVVNLSE